MEGVWKELYHENILEEDSNQVNNTYVECLVSSKKKAKRIFDKEEALKINALFESDFRKGIIIDLKTKKRISCNKEVRVYVVDESEHNSTHLNDEQFMTLAEGLGRVFTLDRFQTAFNNEEINTNTDLIRIIETECSI